MKSFPTQYCYLSRKTLFYSLFILFLQVFWNLPLEMGKRTQVNILLLLQTKCDSKFITNSFVWIDLPQEFSSKNRWLLQLLFLSMLRHCPDSFSRRSKRPFCSFKTSHIINHRKAWCKRWCPETRYQPKSKHVYFESISLSSHDLRSHRSPSPQRSMLSHFLLCWHFFWKAKVRDLKDSIMDQYVSRL